MNPNKFCFILRGLPGVGKDIVADYLNGKVIRNEDEAIILSTDSYFMKDGEFLFDKTRLAEAHKATFEAFKSAVAANTGTIIVNNTNIKQFHYYHYLDYAQRHGYLTALVIIPHNDTSNKELAERNIHGVDQDTIRRMRQSFEWGLNK